MTPAPWTGEPKVFCIGLNKTGTTSLHVLFRRSNLKSVHFGAQNRPNLAQCMFTNRELGRRLLVGYEDFTCFSDMNFLSRALYIDGNRLFRDLDREYPGSYFILSTRDRENWIKSRSQHQIPGKPSLMERFKKATGLNEDEVAELWCRQWQRHHAEVLAHFEGRDDFMLFDIERDDPQKIADFLSPLATIDTRHWGKRNATPSH